MIAHIISNLRHVWFQTGCLNEGKSIARALWYEEQSPEEHPAGEEKNMAEGDAVAAEVGSEGASRADTDISNKSRSSYRNFRNTIVYGLPHITLVPST